MRLYAWSKSTRSVPPTSAGTGPPLPSSTAPPPDDLLDVLVELALGSPAICAAPALARVAPGLQPGDRDLSQAAAHVAGGFRTLFNLPETSATARDASYS